MGGHRPAAQGEGGGVMVTFFVPGAPQGKGRPRFVRATGRVYTPAKTESYEATLRLFAHQAMAGRAPFGKGEPLSCSVVATFAVPASWSNRKRLSAYAGTIYPTGKPDFDNVLKVLGDALNGVVWHDDAQIVGGSLAKRYGEKPGLAVEVMTLDLHL